MNNSSKYIKKIFVYLSPYTFQLIVIFLILIVATIPKLISPYLFGKIVNIFWDFINGKITQNAVYKKVLYLISLLLIFNICTWIAESIVYYIMAYLSNNILYKLRKNIFTRIQELSLKVFHEYNCGEIISRLINDTDSIFQTLNTIINNFFINFLLLIGIIIAMFLINVHLMIVSLFVFILMVVSTIFFTKKIRDAHYQSRKTLSQINSKLVEDISGIRVTQAFNRQKKNMHHFNQVNKRNKKASMNVASLYAFIYPVYTVINNMGIALTLVFGGYLFIEKIITIGIIVTFALYISKLFHPIKSLSSLWYDIQAGIAASKHIFDFLDNSEILPEKENPLILKDIMGKVEFKSVYFNYVKNKTVLKNINFIVKPGERIAIIGETGSGKTTILNLILRFYDVTDGQILIDDNNIRDLSIESLRKKIGIVLQDTILFSQTILENIRYGRLDASYNEIVNAAKQANAHDFIKDLPDGYNTMLLENGNNLSMGQKQLISIARAILSNPRILILDEATSSVDTNTEILIQKAIEKLLHGRTSFIVAHRLSTIKNADIILVIKDGYIIEKGNHNELVKKKGEYERIYNSNKEYITAAY